MDAITFGAPIAQSSVKVSGRGRGKDAAIVTFVNSAKDACQNIKAGDMLPANSAVDTFRKDRKNRKGNKVSRADAANGLRPALAKVGLTIKNRKTDVYLAKATPKKSD